MSRGQTSVLERGSLETRDHELADTSVDTILGYMSMVGTMLAEELANAEDQVGTLDHIDLSYDLMFLTLGAEGVIPGRYIVSFLRVFKQFTHTLPSG